MYFKQLELFGFKSFAQRTRLSLEKGVSAVVGPNGCGKSNIVDAIRWVLGEQKMSVLRGHQREDVIFAGSDDRHPLGMSEVTLVLDNSDGKLSVDYSEVSITRRLFRSGESEYHLNKLPCRRKDIVELLMGTGTGAGSYSLIEQGRVDLVLSSKPEERRYIFEDAAGIIKYKSRKDAALRKMERADANLLRLQDTIIEVRRQMNSLRRQANAARRYREFKDQLRELELRLALLKYGELSDEHASLARTTNDLASKLEQITADLSTEESDLETSRLNLLELERTISQSSDQSRDFQSQIDKKESEIALLRERASAIDGQERKNQSEIEGIQHSIEGLHQQRAEMIEKERNALEQVSRAQADLAEKEQHLTTLAERLSDCETNIDELRSLSLERLNRKVNLQNELGAIETNLQIATRRIEKLSERKAQIEESLAQHDIRLSETRSMIQSLRAALASLSSEITSQTETIKTKESELDSSIALRDSIRDSLSAARSKLASLEELRDSFEGYEDGVRSIMLAKHQDEPRANGVLGTLADLFSTRQEHEAAITAALGKGLQHIVVEDVDTARCCITLLESDQAGRASFIPVSSFSPNGHPLGSSLPSGVLGTAADMISCDERLRPIADALLRSTLVVSTLDEALTLSSSLTQKADIVTLRGEAVSAHGVITAGNTGHGRGLLGRKNEIEELKSSIEEMTAATEAQTSKIASLKQEIEHARELLQKLRSAVGSHEVELAKAERDLQQLSDSKKREEEEGEVVTREHSLAAHESGELSKQRSELVQQIGHAEKLEAETKDELAKASSRWDELRKRKDELAAEITDFKVNVSSLQLTCETYKHDLSRLETEEREASRRMTEKQKEIEEGRQAKERFHEDVEGCRNAIQETFERKRTLDSELERLTEQKNQLSEKIHLLEEKVKQTRSRVNELSSQHHQTEITLAQVEEKLTFLKEKTLADYHLSMSEIGQEITVEEDFDREAASEEVERLRGKLESMGSVNLIAIEEFEELQQRYDLLIQQEADLRKAKESLIGVIKKINEVTEVMFMETFEEIRTNFHDIFRHLFGGGRASIALIDPTSPLESGIEINVHPPGKKPQSISLLSGGEKALTAISLLFAIFRTKPSPFCVLDEVDAPLDDSNILRFTRLVQMFAKDVQFIIVTHNKRTMELADVLYGVTMEQRGVSQIVSVKLKRQNAFEFLEPTVA